MDADDLAIRGLWGLVVSRSVEKRDEVYVRFNGLLRSERVSADDLHVIETSERRQRRIAEQTKTERDTETSERRVVQLLPADGWWAVFADWRTGPVEIKWELLIAWALLEEGSRQRIEGILTPDGGGVNYAEEKRHLLPFLQYLHRTQDTATNRERLKDMARRQCEYERFRKMTEGEEG